MKQNNLKQSESRLWLGTFWVGVQCLALWFCTSAFATPTLPTQQPILIRTLSQNCASHAWQEAEKALVRELLRSGYIVTTTPAESVLTDSADLHCAENISVVQVVKPPNSAIAYIDIWFCQQSQKGIWHAAVRDLETNTLEAAVVAALKFNELYPAKFEKVQSLHSKSKVVTPASPIIVQTDQAAKDMGPKRSSTFQVGLGAAAFTYFTDAPMRAGPLVQFVWMPTQRVSLSLDMVIGIWGKPLSFASERATLRHYNMAFHMDYLFGVHGVVRPYIGMVLGWSRFQTQGTTPSDLVPAEGQGDSFSGGIQTGIIFAVSNQLYFVTSASAVTLLPNVEIYFGQDSAAKFSRLFGNVSTAIRINF